jgi:hypothetical protein
MEKLLKQVRKYVEPIQTNDQQIAFKVLKFFEIMLDIGKLIMYCIYWGMGSHLSDDGQKKF